MRRSERYTVPEKIYSVPDPQTYRRVYRELPFLQRLYLLIRTWLGSADIATVVKEHELDDVKHEVLSRGNDIADVTIPALMHGFHHRVRAVAEAIHALRPVLSHVRGTAAGAFLRDTFQRIDPETAQTLEAACAVPEELLNEPTTTFESAKKAVHVSVMEALEINKEAIQATLNPVWNSLEALAALSTVDFAGLIPQDITPDTRTPLRIVRDPLVQFTATISLCVKNREPDAIRYAAEYVGHRHGGTLPGATRIWDAIDVVFSEIPLVDLVRLAMDEPRLKMAELQTQGAWWKRFTNAWVERIDVRAPLIRRRSMVVEDTLRNHFLVGENTITWIPPSLYQRSLGAIRRLGAAQLFRDTRTMAGSLAREPDLLPAPDRSKILEAHVEIDKAYAKLEELTGFGEARGAIGDELRRLTQGAGDTSMIGMQKVSLYAKYRPDLRILIDQVVDSLETIGGRFAAHRTAVRRSLKAGTVRIDTAGTDTPPVELLDLITESYRTLSRALRGLFTLEQELTAGAEQTAAEQAAAEREENPDSADERTVAGANSDR